MGDAGPLLPVLGEDGGRQREVTVLVTGFGPFKTFHHNPSHSITSLLPQVLLPNPSTTKPNPTFPPQQHPTITLLTHPLPLRVSYPTITTLVPSLLTLHNPDYILHIGMAAGRRHYALETLAHRDGYTIKDVDGVDGVEVGSQVWNREGCPVILDGAWDGGDVLARWREELRNDGIRLGRGKEGLPDVRLSADAGRFVCDFVFYESLSLRWKGERQRRITSSSLPPPVSSSQQRLGEEEEEAPSDAEDEEVEEEEQRRFTSKEGKVAFLHVPGDTDPAAIERGVRVTVAAIRALVASWEEGYRRNGVMVKGTSSRRHGARGGLVGVESVS